MSEKIIQFGRKTVVAMVHIPALPVLRIMMQPPE